MGYPGLAGRFKGTMLGVARLGDFMGEDFPVTTEGGGVGLWSRVYIDGEGLNTLLHCYLDGSKNAV